MAGDGKGRDETARLSRGFGRLLLIGGVVGLPHAIQARGINFFWLGVVVAALNIAAGVVAIRRPEAAAEGDTRGETDEPPGGPVQPE